LAPDDDAAKRTALQQRFPYQKVMMMMMMTWLIDLAISVRKMGLRT